MSNKITKTVTFEIEPSGDCGKCKARVKSCNHCMAFNDFILANSAYNGDVKYYQLSACRDYLAQQKSNVYCDESKYMHRKIHDMIKINHQRSEIDFSIDTYKVKIYINEETADELLQKYSDNIPLGAIIEQPEHLKLHGLVGLCFDKNIYYLEFKLIGANKCKD